MSTERDSKISRYLPPGHEPHAEPVSRLYADAMRELALPHPAVRFKRFPKLDMITGGLRVNEFTILCGSTGTGKTTLCANLGRDLIEQGIPHFVASVETGHTDFIKRSMCAMASKDWNTGDPVPVELLKDFHGKYGHFFQTEKAWLSLYEDRTPMESLMADIAWMIENRGIKVAMIDNLNYLLKPTRATDAVFEMDRVIHDLVVFAKNVPIHLIMIMHPKKTDGGRVESEFDVKGSATAVQEASNILLFNRPHPDLIKAELARPNDREICIRKMRRKGKYVHRRLVLRSEDGVSYFEGEVV